MAAQTKDNPSSDLCAQWKAANAAYEGAKWGWWQLIIGGFGIASGAITMGCPATAAAVYARRAAIATETTVHVTPRCVSEPIQSLHPSG